MTDIPDIFHFICEKDNLSIWNYYAILSAININNPNVVYLHSYSPLIDKYPKLMEKNIIYNEIKIPQRLFKKFQKSIVYDILYKYGGTYIDINSISINPIKELLLNANFKKTENDKMICSSPKNELTNDLFRYHTNITDKMPNIDDISMINLNYDDSLENINEILNEEITDYSFGQYFHIVKNCFILFFDENLLEDKNANENININKITTYNLLIRHALAYNFINNDVDTNSIFNNDKLKLINNIDTIYWLNMERSVDRKIRMESLLQNIDIKNERINAFDGTLIENIHSTYFYECNGNYPAYSNKEYAILLSHLHAIEGYIKSSNPKYGVAMIIEDDLSFDFAKYWDRDIKNIVENAPCDWDIIMLGYFSIKIDAIDAINATDATDAKDEILYKKWDNEWSAISYLINHKSMQKICDLKTDDGKWKCLETDLMVSDNYIFSKFNTYVYKYPYFTFPNDNDSTLHNDHLDYHRIYKINNYITHEKIFYNI